MTYTVFFIIFAIASIIAATVGFSNVSCHLAHVYAPEAIAVKNIMRDVHFLIDGK